MRILDKWNILGLALLVLCLGFLNYANLLPLYKPFPFLSFLPRAPVEKPYKEMVIPSPTPLPPITIKKIDRAKKTGEFVINNPARQAEPLSFEKQIAEKQMVIDGTYEVSNKKITIQASLQDSYIPIHRPPDFNDSSSIFLRVEMLTNNKLIFRTNMPLGNQDKTTQMPFRMILPFTRDFTINIYDESNKLLLSQPIKL